MDSLPPGDTRTKPSLVSVPTMRYAVERGRPTLSASSMGVRPLGSAESARSICAARSSTCTPSLPLAHATLLAARRGGGAPPPRGTSSVVRQKPRSSSVSTWTRYPSSRRRDSSAFSGGQSWNPRPDLKPRSPAATFSLQQRRRLARRLQVRQDVVVDGQGEVEADHVRVLHGREDGQPQAGAEADALVHRGGVGDAVLDDGDGLAPRARAAGGWRRSRARPSCSRWGACPRCGAAPWSCRPPRPATSAVRTTSTSGMRYGGFQKCVPTTRSLCTARSRDLRDAHHRRVGAQDRLRRAEPVELLEQAALELEVLEDALDHVGRALHRLRQVGGGGDAGHGRLDLVEPAEPVLGKEREIGAHGRGGALERLGNGVLQRDLVPREREDLRDADAHHAGADDGHLLLGHGHPPLCAPRLSRRCCRRRPPGWRRSRSPRPPTPGTARRP